MMPFWWACCTAWQTLTNSPSRSLGVSRCSSQYCVSGTPLTRGGRVGVQQALRLVVGGQHHLEAPTQLDVPAADTLQPGAAPRGRDRQGRQKQLFQGRELGWHRLILVGSATRHASGGPGS